MKNWTITLFFAVLLSGSLSAQTETVIHQTFMVDSIKSLTLNLYGDYDIDFWAGNTILAETKVQLFNGPEHVLKFFIEEQQRYQINDTLVDSTALLLVSHVMDRKEIAYRGTPCREIVRLRLFIPDVFAAQSENVYAIREEDQD